MAKFTVYLTSVASTSVEVEAEDYTDAMELAFEKGMPTICAQCSGWGREYSLDLNDEWEVSAVADESGETVYEEQAR